MTTMTINKIPAKRKTMRLLRVITELSTYAFNKELHEMTTDEVNKIWNAIKNYLPYVAAKTGISKNGMRWGVLLRRMQAIETKATEVI